MKKTFFFLLLTSLFFTACQNEPKTNESFKISINSWIGFAPLYIAQEKGYFDSQGVEVEISRMENTGERRGAMIAGRIDALGSSIDDFMVGIAQGLDARMVLFADHSFGGDGILVKEDIKTIADFKGKKVGVQPGFINHFFLLYLLDKNGMSQADIEVVPMEPDKAATALLNKEIDIAVTWEPHLSVVKEQKGYKLFITTADEQVQKTILDNIIVSTKTIKERPETVKKVVKAWFDAIAFIKSNPDEALEIIAKNFDLPKEDAAAMLTGLQYPSLEENIAFFGDSVKPNAVEMASKAVELYSEAGVIEKKETIKEIKQYFDASFLPKQK